MWLAGVLPLALPYLAVSAVIGLLAWARAYPGGAELVLFLAGAINLTVRLEAWSPQDLRRVWGDRTQLAVVRGTLESAPTLRVWEQGGQERWSSQAVVCVRELQTGEGWVAGAGRVAIRTKGLLDPEFQAGRRVIVSGVMGEPPGPGAEGLFDYRSYLSWQGIYYQLKAESPADWQLAEEADAGRPLSWETRFTSWAQAALARGLPEEDEALRLIWAMALGWKTALTPEVSLPFMRTGTMHIFAISGLHVALIAGILVHLLRVMRVPRAACGVVVIPCLWFYTAATGWQSSAIRSTVMMTVVILGWALSRPSHLLNSLMAAAFLLLAWEPRQLFQASFQLSFFVVLSLALWVPRLEQIYRPWLEPDPLLPAELRPQWRRWLGTPMNWLAASLATSLAAWLGSLPLIAAYFHLVTPVSLMANLVIVPLSSLALMCHLGSLLCAPWSEGLTGLWNHSGWLWMQLMIEFAHWASDLPGAYWHVRSPSFGAVGLYYGLLVTVLMGSAWRPVWRRWVLGGWGILAALWLGQRVGESRQCQLIVLDAGDGACLYYDAPGTAKDLLVDTGSEANARWLVGPFLQAQGVNRLRHLLITHGDTQHVGGSEAVETLLPVDQVLVSGLPARSQVYRRHLRRWRSHPGQVREVKSGDRQGDWTVLHPGAGDRFPLADDNAIVLSGQIHSTRVLLLSDLGREGQAALWHRAEISPVDVVVVGLPVKGVPLLPELLVCLQPKLIIFTCNARHYPGRLGLAARRFWAATGAQVVCTGDCGPISLTFNPRGWEARTLPGRRITGGTPEESDRVAKRASRPGGLPMNDPFHLEGIAPSMPTILGP